MIRTLVLLAALLVCSLAVETEHVALLKIPNPEDVVALIKRGISLDHPNKKHQTFEAYITEKDIPILKEFNVEYEIQANEIEHVQEKRANVVDYHNYAALTSMNINSHLNRISPTLLIITAPSPSPSASPHLYSNVRHNATFLTFLSFSLIAPYSHLHCVVLLLFFFFFEC
jgi:hypothetical protein